MRAIAGVDAQTEARIEGLIVKGTVTYDDDWEDRTTLFECARRYVEDQALRRERNNARAKEHSAIRSAIRISPLENRDQKILKRIESVAIEASAATDADWIELLDVVIPIGDGTKMTWGDASKEDFRSRIVMMNKSIAGNVQTVALLEKAYSILDKTGARTLRELGNG